MTVVKIFQSHVHGSIDDGLYHQKLRKLLYIGLYFPRQPGVQFLHYTIYQVFNYCRCLVCNYKLGHGVRYLLSLSGGVDYNCRSLLVLYCHCQLFTVTVRCCHLLQVAVMSQLSLSGIYCHCQVVSITSLFCHQVTIRCAIATCVGQIIELDSINVL